MVPVDESDLVRVKEDAHRDASIRELRRSMDAIIDMIERHIKREEDQSERLWGELRDLRRELNSREYVTTKQLDRSLLDMEEHYEVRLKSIRNVVVAWISGVAATGTLVTWLLTSEVVDALVTYKQHHSLADEGD